MIDPASATIVTIILIGFLWIGVPLLESIPKVRDHISRRFILTSVLVCLAVAACIDFSALETNVRFAIIIGGFTSGILMTVLYTIEKMSYTKAFGLKRVKLNWREKSFETEFDPKQEQPKAEQDDDLKGLAERENKGSTTHRLKADRLVTDQ